MSKSIGQIIKALRKERNYTQEELAELLNVTGQAISKWENETSMPDISQIVPIAKVFGISTDVLFDTFGTNDEDEVNKIIKCAQKQIYDINGNYSKEGIYTAYLTVQEGLKRYPNNMVLLLFSLSQGMALAYPDNDCYDMAHAKEIYEESIRQANIVISYSKNNNDVLHAHMLMVLFHSINGNMNKAQEHAEQFPIRSDMTYYNMNAYISHAEGKYADESFLRQKDCLYLLEAMLDNIALNGKALMLSKKYKEALMAFNTSFDLIKLFFKDEKHLPPMYIRECGDINSLIAETYVRMGDVNKAVNRLGKMVDYELVTRENLSADIATHSPLLPGEEEIFYHNNRSRNGRIESLLAVLNDDIFNSLKANKNYQIIIDRVVVKQT